MDHLTVNDCKCMHEIYNNHKSFTLYIHNLNRIELKLSLLKGFVKISANWSFVLTNFEEISPFFTCFVLLCKIEFLLKLIALVLSQKMGTFLRTIP